MTAASRVRVGLLAVMGLVVIGAALLLLDEPRGTVDGEAIASPPVARGPEHPAPDRDRTPKPAPAPAPDDARPLPADAASVDAAPDPREAHDLFDRRALREHRVSGRVVDAAGAPVPDARVTLLPAPDVHLVALSDESGAFDAELLAPRTARTDPEGRFRLAAPGLAASTGRFGSEQARLLAEADGHAAARLRVAVLGGADIDVGDVELGDALEVAGRVVDETNRPVPGVEVAIGAQNASPWSPGPPVATPVAQAIGDRVQTTRTGDDGRFLLAGAPRGGADVLLRLPGSLAVSGGDLRPSDDEQRVDLGDLLLPVGNRLAGRVIDGQGRPVRGARVHVSTDSARRAPGTSADASLADLLQRVASPAALTDADGRFVLAGLPSGVVSVGALAAGLGSTWIDRLALDGPAPELVLPPCEPWELVVTEAPAGIELRATASTWRRASALVAGLPACPDAPRLVPGTEPGRFTVHGVAPEGTRLVLRAHDLASRSVAAHELPVDERGARVLATEPACVLTGSVSTGPDRRPVVGARVTLRPETSMAAGDLRTVESDDDGRFRLGGLPAAELTSSVHAAGFVDFRPGVPNAPEQLVLDDAHRQVTLDVVLHRAGSIEGVLLAHDGTPLPRKDVRLEHQTGGPRGIRLRTRTARDGRFDFADLSPGPYLLASDQGVALPIQVRPGPPLQVELVAPVPARVRGVVHVGERPLADASVTLVLHAPVPFGGNERPVGGASTDAQGRFTLEAGVDGEYALRVQPPGRATMHEQILALRPGDDLLVDVALADRTLEGRVVDAVTGAGIPQASVRLGGPRHTLARTRDDGRFAFPAIDAGEWTMHVSADGYAGAELGPLAVPPDGNGKPFEALEVALVRSPESASMWGRITDADGLAAPGGTSVLVISGVSRRYRTGVSEGYYRVRQLPPGDVEVQAGDSLLLPDGDREYRVLTTVSLTLLPGEDRRVDLVLADPEDAQAPTPRPGDLIDTLRSLGYIGDG